VPYWKKIIRLFNIGVVVLGLSIPLVLFLNRFLIPDRSFDTVNYHLYLGFKGFNTENSKFEFFPTGIHNYPPILDMSGFLLMKLFGYRLGSIGSLVFLYLSIWVVYKIFRLYQPKFNVLDHWWWGLVFVSIFLSFEAFMQLATYLVDIEVTFLNLLCIYYLFRYEICKNIKFLLFSALTFAILIYGKMTSWYFILPYFFYVFLVLLNDLNLRWKQKFFNFFSVIIISIVFVLPWLWRNYSVTGNPVFPYYNSIFKSEYFPYTDYQDPRFGGTNLGEKLLWGIVSIKKVDRLCQARDLFHDFRINFYFVFGLLVLVWSLLKKDKMLLKLTSFYLLIYICWSLLFGYLRYALLLEFLGGLIILIFLSNLRLKSNKYLLFFLLLLIVVDGLIVINKSFKYDLSWRNGFSNDSKLYMNQIKNINNNKISIDSSLINKYQPDVYLNCTTPTVGYYVLAGFNRLPVFNISRDFYSDLTNNEIYMNKQRMFLSQRVKKKVVNFVTIVVKDGMDETQDSCLKNLYELKYDISEVFLTNLIGYDGQKLSVIFGSFIL